MENNTNDQMSGMKQQLCTVTPLSKVLAAIVFITLPFVGFWLGRQYPVTTPIEMPDMEATSEASTEVETEQPETINNTDSVNVPTNTPPASNPAPAPAGPTVLTVYITEMTTESVSVDNIGIYEGNAGVQRMIADGLCSAAEPQKCTLTDGFYYRNTDPTVQTYSLSENLVVRTWTGTEYSIGKLINGPRTKQPYTITLSTGGVVTQIKEVYRP